MLINLSTIDFSSVSSGSSSNIQEEKTVNMLLTDNSIDILPDTGFDGMAKVIVSHAPVQETVEQTITENGSHIITPNEGYDAMIQCVVDVNVQSGGEFDFSSIGYTPEMTNEINDKINNDIAYSEQLLAEYSDTKKYSFDKKLVYAPLFPTQNRTSFYEMFNDCNKLISIPALDTNKGTSFRHMFHGCSSLTILPALDTSNGVYFESMFYLCSSLTTIPILDTGKGTNFESMFDFCSLLTTIQQLDISNGAKFTNMFSNCSELTDITLTGSINANILFISCPKLSYDSIKSILTACSNTTNTDAKTVSFNRTIQDQNNELTNLVATCTSKGWTVSGLTITQ